jgi:RHS repeat-associated protein
MIAFAGNSFDLAQRTGAPTFWNSLNTQLSTSNYRNRFLFTGREYAATYAGTYIAAFNFYEYRARAYNPVLGRFTSEDPKGFDAGDYNLFRYCHNDPLDLTDPMGLYGMGIGWTPEQWKKFDKAQQAAANSAAAAAGKLDKAIADKATADKAGKESKVFKSESKAFEKTFGKGTGTAENMAKVSGIMKQMETALRDDGSKGYVANAMTKDFVASKGWSPRTFGRGDVGGNTIRINVDHPLFGNQSALSWTAGHESSHNAGIGDHAYKWQPGYRSLTPEERMDNADSYMDFSR